MAESEWPAFSNSSGSGWGEDELEIYRFERQAQSFPFQDFPWPRLFPDSNGDPIVDINTILSDMFGPGADSSLSPLAARASSFYDLLRDLTRAPVRPRLRNIPRTRSMARDYSSPSLPSATTQRLESSNIRASTSQLPSHESPLRPTGPIDPISHHWLRRNTDLGIAGFEESLDRPDREQSPTVVAVERRSLGPGDLDANPGRDLEPLLLEQATEAHSQRGDSLGDNQDSGSENSGYQMITQAPINSSPQSSIKGRSLTHILASETNLPSSEPSSTYRANLSLVPTSSSPIFTSSPPLAPVLEYTDQAEEITNSMMHALLNALCNILSKTPASESARMIFHTSADKEALKIPTGDGGFVKTIPDLKVSVQKGDYSIPILDYEGKRLKPNMTPIEKHAQRVAHLVGRAAWNRSTGATRSRTVYLLTTQHTSVRIMQCTMLHKWLDRLPSDIRSLKSFARVQVQEYGPLDLADGAERLVAVQMLCRLMIGLEMAVRLL